MKVWILLSLLATGCASGANRRPSADYMRRFFCSNEGGGWTEIYLLSPTKLTVGKYGPNYLATGSATVNGEPATIFESPAHDQLSLQTRMISGEHGGGMVQFGNADSKDVRGCAEED